LNVKEDLNDALVAAIPELRAFAISLCGRAAIAEDHTVQSERHGIQDFYECPNRFRQI
jgi:hypothetical protein